MQSKVKQRIVGAVVLIGLVIILLPLIFRGGDNSQEQSVTLSPQMPLLPPKPNVEALLTQEVSSATQKQEELAAKRSTSQEKDEPSQYSLPQDTHTLPQPPSPAVTHLQTNPIKVPVKAKEPHTKPAHTAQKTTLHHQHQIGKHPTAWVIQLATFGDEAHAKRLKDKLKKQGYKAFVKTTSVSHGKLYRVMVGPIPRQHIAQKLQKNLMIVAKLKGMVVEAA